MLIIYTNKRFLGKKKGTSFDDFSNGSRQLVHSISIFLPPAFTRNPRVPVIE